jgi:hypothetical protein
MPGTGPRHRVAIALSFVVQAVLIAGALALAADSSTSVSSSSVAPEAVTVVPLESPPAAGVAAPWNIPVTVKIGAAGIVATYPAPGPESQFLLEPGSDVTATVTLPASYSMPGLSFSLTDKSSLVGTAPSSLTVSRPLLNVPSVPGQGTLTFTLHLGALEPGRDMIVYMTVTRPYDSNMFGGVIAEIATS